MNDKPVNFHRTYSYFDPDFTYRVTVNDPMLGCVDVGSVARIAGQRWWLASNKTWAGGHDFPYIYASRRDAATALVNAARADAEQAAAS